ncbi:hypothetical protein D3C80_1758350 [compost metagenome]
MVKEDRGLNLLLLVLQMIPITKVGERKWTEVKPSTNLEIIMPILRSTIGRTSTVQA